MSNDVTVSISEAKDVLTKVIEKGDTSVNCFLHSSPGIGKSSVVKQIAAEHELDVVDLRLATIEPTDLCGIPYVNKSDMAFSVPSWFPRDPESKGIIFLDELSNANISVQHAAYRLVLDREVQNDRKLPKGWFVVAAGNLRTDQTGAKQIVPALANRFSVHLNIAANLQDFTTYAVMNKIDSRIVGFLNFNNSALYRAPSADSIAFATPRSWEQASKLLGYGFGDGALTNVLSGCIGPGTATEFLSYLKYYKDLPNFTEIMAGKAKYKVPVENLGLMFACATSAMYAALENHKDKKKLENLNKIFEQLPDDCLIMIFKTFSMTRNPELLLNVIDGCESSYERVQKYIK